MITDLILTLHIQSDVNTVTFADETGNLIYSGSDDNLCKVIFYLCYTFLGTMVISEKGNFIIF